MRVPPPKTVAVIQARMGSTRLPGKVMKPIAGRPMIGHVVERTRNIEGVDEVVVATSTDPREEPLVDYVSEISKVRLFRGPEEDVLRRYYDAAVASEADLVIRITGDCPLLSPRVGTRVLTTYLENRESVDYVTNTLERTFPRGLDTAVMSFEALQRAHREAVTSAEREHVTLYIWSNPEKFDLLNVSDESDRHHHRWTVDTDADLRLVRKIYDELYRESSIFEYEEVLEVVDDHPEWSRINRDVEQKSVDGETGTG